MLVVVFVFFLVFTKCCLSCWLSIIFTSSVLILSIYFLVCNSFPSCCHSPNLEENLWLLDHQLLPNPLCIFHISSRAYSWGCDVADCWIKFSPLFVPTFSLLVYWCVVYFQKPKITHLVELSLLGCERFSPWGLSCRALGDWVTSTSSLQ